MNNMLCKRCGVGKISKHYGVGHGSVKCWPLFLLECQPLPGSARMHVVETSRSLPIAGFYSPYFIYIVS